MNRLFCASTLVAAITAGCSQPVNTNSSSKPAVSPSVAVSVTPVADPAASPPPVAQVPTSNVKSLPPSGGDIPRPGQVKGYTYTYKKDETKTVATFAGKLLPADNNLMLDAVRDVVQRSYGDSVDSAPRITGSGPSRTVRVASKRHDYLIVVVNDEQGEVRALIITQMDLPARP